MEIVFELQPQFYQCQIPKGQNAKKGVFSLEIMCLFVQHRNIKLYIYQQLQLLIDISSGTSIRSDSKQFSEKRAQEQKNTFDENEKYFFFILWTLWTYKAQVTLQWLTGQSKEFEMTSAQSFKCNSHLWVGYSISICIQSNHGIPEAAVEPNLQSIVRTTHLCLWPTFLLAPKK